MARKKNEILPTLQAEFEAQLLDGTVLELPTAESWGGDLEALLGVSA